jgi:nucleoside-diphosphate-sugar epimerase
LEVTEIDRKVITAMGDVLGTGKPFLVTSGVGLGSQGPGTLASEDVFWAGNPHPRKATEEASNALLERGLNMGVVRLPQVHDTRKQGLITPLIDMYKQKGVVTYVGEGQNRWAAGALADVAELYKLAFYKAEKGARYNAVGEEGVTAREIAETLAEGLQLPVKSITPEEAAEYWGWMAMFATTEMAASSQLTQERLGWKLTGPGLIEDLKGMKY